MVFCNACMKEAVFVDHGPNVGKGWYCRSCKDDVPHWENEYGIDGSKKRKQNFTIDTSVTMAQRKGAMFIDPLDLAIQAFEHHLRKDSK